VTPFVRRTVNYRRTPSILRGLSLIAIVGVVAAMSTAAATAAPTESSSDEISIPSTAWSPPAEVNRTATGAAPPTQLWAGVTINAVNCDPGVATGVMKQFPLERFSISDRAQLLVNTANGNVVVSQSDLVIKGTGENLSIDHTY